MSGNNWLKQWEQNRIPFHKSVVNSFLEHYWPALKLAKNTTVLVPLCGKSLDMIWLAQQGHQVIGIELSPIACENFFRGNKLDYKKESKHNFTCYFNSKIKLYCGDFFRLTQEQIPPISAVYDRAALIALPKDLRKKYVDHLLTLLPTNSQILLLSPTSTHSTDVAPYSVDPEEVHDLYSSRFNITLLLKKQREEIEPHLRNNGHQEIQDFVYLLGPKP